MSSFFRERNRNSPQGVGGGVSVEIRSAVFDRIQASIAGSGFEEGGKLLGKISQDAHGVTIHVETFLDSGPRVDKSASHILPDGKYQESLFRLIEVWDPDIEHVGTWHSHHCNGLESLSGGDIRGYIESVNDPRYGLQYFFVMLIVGTTRGEITYRCYLFQKGSHNFCELPDKAVMVILGTYRLEGVLNKAEKVSASMSGGQVYRTPHTAGNSAKCIGNHSSSRTEKTLSTLDCQELRRIDNLWFRSNFDEVEVRKSGSTGRLAWIAEKQVGHIQLTLRYVYPALMQGKPCAEVEVLVDGERCGKRHSVPLDNGRFAHVENLVKKAVSKARRVRNEQTGRIRKWISAADCSFKIYNRRGGIEKNDS